MADLRNGIDKIREIARNHDFAKLYDDTRKRYGKLSPKQQKHFDYLMGKQLDPYDFPYTYDESTDTLYLDGVEEKKYKYPRKFDDGDELKKNFQEGGIDEDFMSYIWNNLRKD